MGSGNAGQPAAPSRPHQRHNNNSTTHSLKQLDDDIDIDDELLDDPTRILVTTTTTTATTLSSIDPTAIITASATITLLDLSCSKLAWLPRERFVGCVGVTELVLNNNRLSRLPHELFALPNVRVARFEFNELVDLPAEIGQWSASLEVLVANNNRLKKLPPQMGCLKRLRQLNLHCNQLITLPMSLLELDIRVLTLHANPALSENLKRICQAVFSLREDTLDLSHCGPIRDQVEEQALSYARLTRELRLEGNALHSLPTAVGRFFRLQSLMVDDNQISAIPVHLCKLPAITRLSMADNKLAHLPVEIGLLTSLRFINMDNNFLSVLPPSFFHLVNLEELSLANNKIESVSGDVGKLKKLQRLNMANNKIRALPQELFTLTQLRALHLEYNSISVLPDGFSNLQLLREVNLHDNLLTRTPIQLYQLPNIRRLSFENNPIGLASPSDADVGAAPDDLARQNRQPRPTPQRLQIVQQPNLYLFSFANNSPGRRAGEGGPPVAVETAREREKRESDGPRLDVNTLLSKRNSLPTNFSVVSRPGQSYFSLACNAAEFTMSQPTSVTSSPAIVRSSVRQPSLSVSTPPPPSMLRSLERATIAASAAAAVDGSPNEKKATKTKKDKAKMKKKRAGSKTIKREKEKEPHHKREAAKEEGAVDAHTPRKGHPAGVTPSPGKKTKKAESEAEGESAGKRPKKPVRLVTSASDAQSSDDEKSIQHAHTASLSSLPYIRQDFPSGKERAATFTLPPKTGATPLHKASRDLPAPSFSKGERSRSLSRAFNMSPVQKEQLLQYQKQRKSQQGQGSLSKSSGLALKKKSPKEAVPEQQVMNPLYLLFSPLSATATVSPAPSASPSRRRYGTISGRTLNASDRVASSFGLAARRKVVHNDNTSGGGGSSSEPQPERVVINPLLRLRTDLAPASARGSESPPSPVTRFTTSTSAAPTIIASLSGSIPITSRTPLTDRPSHSPTSTPLSMSENTKRALGQKNSASLIDTNRGASAMLSSAEADKPLKKTFSSPDINLNKRRADTIARRHELDAHRSANADAASDEDDDDNAGEHGEDDGEYDEENEEDEGYSSVDGDLRALERDHLASDDASWTTSEEDRATDPADGHGVPVLNLSPLVRRRKGSDPTDVAPVAVQRSSSHQFGKLNSLSSSNPEIVSARGRRRRAEQRAKITNFFGTYPYPEEEFFSDNSMLEEGKRKRRDKVIKIDEGNATDRVHRKGHDDEKRLSGLRNSTKEKRATTLLQPGSIATPWSGVKNKRHLSIPAISPEDGISQDEFLETISSLQNNCNKRAIKVKGDQIMYDDKTAQNLFKWQEKNSELMTSADKTPLKGFDKSMQRDKKSNSQYKINQEREPQLEVRPRKSSFFDEIPNELELQFVLDESGRTRPMRGTLEKLVQLLAHEQGRDVEFESDFLYSYRDFTNPADFFECLTHRFNSVGPMTHPDTFVIVRKRVLYVLRRWMELLNHDFAENDHALFHSLTEWMDTVPTQGLEGAFRKFREWTEARFIRNQDFTLEERQSSDDRPPVPYLPINVTSSSLHLLDLHPEEVARQMTLIESELFRKIQPHEWLNQSWTRSDKKKRAPGIMGMIRRFNDISGWLATEIVSAATVEHRVVLVNRFLVIAKKCLELKNFNGVMEILSGLETASVQRLKQTWHNLPRKSWDMFEELTDLMSLPQNFKKFRQQINALSPPCVPYIGIFLKDIIFIEQGAQELDGRMINFEKRTMVAKIVRQMVSFQPYVYNLIPVEFIQEFLFSMKPLNEDDLYHKSLQLEGIGASLPANKKRHKSMFYFPLGANSPRRHSVKEYSSPDDSSS